MRSKKLIIRDKIAVDHVQDLIKYAIYLYKIGEHTTALKTGRLARWFIKNFGIGFKNKWQKYYYCKKCKNILFPGVNMIVRVRRSREKHIIIRCKICGGVKRIPLRF